MKFISFFDVIGPNMIGPSSSHTAGAVAIGNMAAKLFRNTIKKVKFTLYGSFAQTYYGHGTDRALLGGVMGFLPSDERIVNAFEEAEKREIQFEYLIDHKTKTGHPNTADIYMEAEDGTSQTIRGESLGGGKIRITNIDEIDVDFTGEYSTLVIRHEDRPGIVAHISAELANNNVNIAFMKVFRKKMRVEAYTVVESDEKITEEVMEHLYMNSGIDKVLLIQI